MNRRQTQFEYLDKNSIVKATKRLYNDLMTSFRSNIAIPIQTRAGVCGSAEGGLTGSDESGSIACFIGRRLLPIPWTRPDPGAAIAASRVAASGRTRCFLPFAPCATVLMKVSTTSSSLLISIVRSLASGQSGLALE